MQRRIAALALLLTALTTSPHVGSAITWDATRPAIHEPPAAMPDEAREGIFRWVESEVDRPVASLETSFPGGVNDLLLGEPLIRVLRAADHFSRGRVR